MATLQLGLPADLVTGSKDDVQARIVAAKKALGPRVVILGHHYQRDEVIRHADFTGDSFKLAQLATTRPDISTQVRFRKEEEMRNGANALRAGGFGGEVKVLTSCPSCLQGLSRFDDDAGTKADYIVVEMAKRILGPDWLPAYVARANAGGIERVLV